MSAFKSYNEPVIGIVGGMGPQAGVMLCNQIVSCTDAYLDQQHLPVILMSFPERIADRTAFLEGYVKTNPAYQIVKVIQQLERAGASIVGMACNTSHAGPILDVILEELDVRGSNVKLLNMPAETCHYLSYNHPEIKRVGLMATNGTYRSGVYETLLRKNGYVVVQPDLSFQEEVIHRMIYDPIIGIKANPDNSAERVKHLTEKALCFFRNNDAQAIILGCTELSLVLTDSEAEGMVIVDSTKALAKALVNEATYARNIRKKLLI
jgi:aspartate racemase